MKLQTNKFFHQTIKLFITALVSLGCSISAYAVTDKIVAIVNEQVITQSEVHTRVVAIQQHLSQMPGATIPSRATIRQKVLNELIDRELQLQLAKRNNIQIPEQAVDGAIASIAKRNNITLAQMQQELQKQGVKYTDFRKQIRDDMTISHVVQQALAPKIKISEDEVDRALRNPPTMQPTSAPTGPAQYHATDILVPTAEHADSSAIDAAKKAATTIAEKLRKGETFDNAIKDISVAGGAIQNSDLGWRTTKDLPALFVAAITKLRPQEVTDPIVAPNGIHVIKLLEAHHPEAQQPPMKLTRNDARELVYRNKIGKLINPWLQQMRATAYIKIVDEK